MLFKQRFLAGIKDGSVRVAYRRWKKPTVKEGGTLLTPVGQLAIDEVSRASLEDIGPDDAKLAGYDDCAALVQELERRSTGDIYKISFRLAGPDPRIALREKGELTSQELEDLASRLSRWDKASKTGPWTRSALRAIRDRPGVRAPDLAEAFGVETLVFKRNVRKLKGLGLTESLKVGYRLSPRGHTTLAALEQPEG